MPDPLSPSPRRQTVAHDLAGNRSSAAAKKLRSLLAEPGGAALLEATDGNGRTPLMFAINSMAIHAIRALLESGADVNAVSLAGNSIAHQLVRPRGVYADQELPPIFEILLKAGADLSARNRQGQTVAQAMAAKAPLASLALAMERRPQDFDGDDPHSSAARDALIARGPAAIRLLEIALLTRAASPGSPSSKPRSL